MPNTLAQNWQIIKNLWDTFGNNPDNQKSVDAMKGMLGLLPGGAGDVSSGLLAADDFRRGDVTSGLLNGVGVLPYVPSLAGMFIGKNSKVWDAVKADEAQKMLAAGADPKEVWKQTGTFKGVDGALRQEIDDSSMSQVVPLKEWVNQRADGKYNAPNVSAAWDYAASQLTPEAPVRAKRLFKHDELAKAYPHGFTKNLDNQSIMDVPVQISQGNSQGSWGDDGILALHESLLPQPAKSTTLHELQHAIQEREGWARGGSPESMGEYAVTPEIEAARKIVDLSKQFKPDRVEKIIGEWNDPELVAKAKRLIDVMGKDGVVRGYDNAVASGSVEAYKRLAGEAEARLTQSRMNMTMPERLQVYPYDMLDVPQDQLIVRGFIGDAPTTGDWVTTSKAYAKQHGESALGGNYKILSQTVPARKLYTNGDSWAEFGYDETGKINPALLPWLVGGGLLGAGGMYYSGE